MFYDASQTVIRASIHISPLSVRTVPSVVEIPPALRRNHFAIPLMALAVVLLSFVALTADQVIPVEHTTDPATVPKGFAIFTLP
jgi:hypothetical protein